MHVERMRFTERQYRLRRDRTGAWSLSIGKTSWCIESNKVYKFNRM